ncbi:MAG: CHAP domain-containing protein [Actinomycetota bacterium]|nr:CHAP domain-containing protein [Actinomycetota bacterium]
MALAASAALTAALITGASLPAAATPAGSTTAPAMRTRPALASAHQVGAVARYAGGGMPAFGDAPNLGGLSSFTMNAPATALAATPSGKGTWVAAADGGIFAFGDAPYLGSMGGQRLYAPIVGIAATPDGRGYWEVAADGGIFAFGDAAYLGSMGGQQLAQPIVGIAATPDGRGYWEVAADGGIFAFGDAPYLGSAAGQPIGTWVTGMAATPDGQGYWLVAATAGVLSFGDASFYGPTPNNPPFSPTAAIAATPDGHGYWLLQPDDGPISFTPAEPGAVPPGASQVVQVAASQIGPDPASNQGAFCNPYGPCEDWCALFATWVWQQAGVPVPELAFVGDVYTWGAANGTVLAPTAMPQPGDAILYGTGPQNTTTSPHMGLVAQVWPDGAVVTIEGDAGPQPDGKYGVVANGPFLPADGLQSPSVELPTYAYVQP